MIIGLSGAKGSGKDTVAAHLVKAHGFERKAFADPLKRSVAALFDIPFAEIEKLKNNPDACVVLQVNAYSNDSPHLGSQHDMTFRTFLQRYGTESHRDIFGEDFWMDVTLPVGAYYAGRAIVITDCRFRNEAERIRSLGGVIWRIHRKAAQDDTKQHSSEVCDFMDLVWAHIHNDGTIDELAVNVEALLGALVDD